MNQEIRGQRRSGWATGLLFVLVPVLAGAGVFCQWFSLDMLRQVRMLERLPLVETAAAVPGPIRIAGTATPLDKDGKPNTIAARWTGKPAVWVRAVEEVERRDSDGDKYWDTVSDETTFVDFDLVDDSGRILVVPDHGIETYLAQSYRQRKGDRRYTEYRIDAGAAVRVVGTVSTSGHGSTQRLAVIFNQPGEYVPILANRDLASIRGSKGLWSTLLISGSLLGFSGACVAFMLAFRFLNTLAFVVVVGTIEIAALLVGGTLMVADDLAGAQRSLGESLAAAETIVARGFQDLPNGDAPGADASIDWKGDWNEQTAFQRAANAGPTGKRLVAIRTALAERCRRTAEVRGRFPQWLVAKATGLPPVPTIDEAPADRSTIGVNRIATADAGWFKPMLGVATAAILGTIGVLVGLARVKRKRLIENVPTTPCAEPAVGITEIAGTARYRDPEAGEARLVGPLTDEPCVWFDYHVQEYRGTGKDRHLVTIEHRVRGTRFLCEDSSGTIPIEPRDATVVSGRSATRKKGKRVYTEESIRDGDPLYGLGSAELDPETGDSLRLQRNPDGLPYILSNLPEDRLKVREITLAFWLLAIGMTAGTSLALFLVAFIGGSSALDQLTASVGSIGLVGLIVLVILYNDLVFLQQQTRSARSNIDVALKKRFDLMPQLERVTSGYAAHESRLQGLVAELRASATAAHAGGGDEDRTEAEQAIEAGVRRLLAVRESYPDLKADAIFGDLMRRITTLENEISARRSGFNAAVERYRSRIRAVPEVFLAKAFGFRDLEYLAWDTEIIDMPDIEFLAPPEDAESGSTEEDAGPGHEPGTGEDDTDKSTE